VSDGYEVSSEKLKAFSKHLSEMHDDLKSSGDQVGGVVGDPGIFGILGGQLCGAAASAYCAQARDGFHGYAGTADEFAGRIDDTVKGYDNTEVDVHDLLSGIDK
jgi:hypothetical protein